MSNGQTKRVQFDPFFDSDGNAAGTSTTLTPAVTLPRQYQDVTAFDPDAVSKMRPSSVNLNGTVIPRATRGGVPVGTHIHDTRGAEIVIDPHIPGQSTVVKLANVTAASLSRAVSKIDNSIPDDGDIRTSRLRASATFFALNDQQAQSGVAAAVEIPEADYVAVPRPMNQQPMQPGPATRRTASPLTAFDQPQRRPQMPQQAPPFQQQYQPQDLVGPPTIEVVFELEQFGTLPARYHDVVIETGFIVLVFDNRHVGSMKYFPKANTGDTNPRMAMAITGANAVYLVATTGLQFIHDQQEYCILLIEQTGLLQPEGDYD